MRSAYQHLNPTATTDESAAHKDDIADKAFASHNKKQQVRFFSAFNWLKKSIPNCGSNS
jgi:hypothetical protein